MSRAAPLRSWLTPPEPDGPGQYSITRTICGIAVAIAVVVTPLDLLLIVLVPSAILRWIVILVAVDGGCALLLLLARLGHPRAAGRLFAVASWLAMTVAAATAGGVSAPSIVAQPVIPVIAAMVLGWEEGLVAAGVCVVTVFGLAWAQTAGVLPAPAFTHTPFSRAVVIASWVGVLGALVVVIARNMSAARESAEKELRGRRAAQAKLGDVIDNAPFAAFSFELRDGVRLLVTGANRSADRIIGVDAQRFVGMTLEEAFPQLVEVGADTELHRVARDGGTWDTPDLAYKGEFFQGVLELHAFQTAPGAMTVFFSDVTEKRKAEEQVRYLAYHDPLTQLPNRKLFNDRLHVALANAQRGGVNVGLLFVDLDGFKPINDRFGHAFGDDLLSAIGERLRSSARAGDTVARFGGDEFMVLLPQVEGIGQVEAVARKLLALLAEPFDIHGEEVAMGASAGLSITSAEDYDPASLIQRADHAMYRMKSEGRGGFRIWE